MLKKLIQSGLPILLLALLTLNTGCSGTPQAESLIEKHKLRLNLTSNQITALRPILQKHHHALSELKTHFRDTNLSKANRQRFYLKMTVLEKDLIHDTSHILTAKQMKEFKRIVNEEKTAHLRINRPKKRHHSRPHPHDHTH